MNKTLRFPLLGEPLALDLVNTRIRDGVAIVDLLDTPVALAAWLQAERKRVSWTGPVVDEDLTAVQALRTAIDSLLRAQRAHARPAQAALRTVNRAVAAAAQPKLVWAARGAALAKPPARARRDALLQAIAADAVAILTGPQATRLRTCAHPGCVLQFIARNPRRRWCVSAVCGNRARVARHYQLRHQTV